MVAGKSTKTEAAMNKTAIKSFAIWAKNKLIADISYKLEELCVYWPTSESREQARLLMAERGRPANGYNTPQLATGSRQRRRVQGLPCGVIPIIWKRILRRTKVDYEAISHQPLREYIDRVGVEMFSSKSAHCKTYESTNSKQPPTRWFSMQSQ